MTTITQDDFIQSIADGLQFISYYHPLDYIQAVGRAWEREQSPAAKDALAQILVNSRMCAEGHRPICQDTGAVNVFLKIGMAVRWDDPAFPQAFTWFGTQAYWDEYLGILQDQLRKLTEPPLRLYP
jgi:tartrate dehydratase alpha subunit/fumarate hydratase class I-like protein